MTVDFELRRWSIPLSLELLRKIKQINVNLQKHYFFVQKMRNKNTYKCLKLQNTGYENTNIHHAIVFNNSESGTQASDMLDMSTIPQNIYYKMQSHRTHRKTISLSRIRRTKYAKSLGRICLITSINSKQAQKI